MDNTELKKLIRTVYDFPTPGIVFKDISYLLFIMVRKKGKLPGPVLSCDYGLEYGRNVLEIQDGITKPGQKAVIIDDVLATGGTLEAIIKLLHREKVEVLRVVVLMELDGFDARQRLNVDVESLIKIEKGE
ncbi:purine phosphoribosyltransferase family protein [[Mycoplasma] gypis]|uniref:purine phosphoribosyltransferase family protein n=1 Tax=[Mycoplasma] gypis TaxID=92404 RepID=UPI0019688F0D|nr:purine phosphoribosyltransferase family protein [[Mycoplasma] gypis]MBN0919551.1 purine phosphoribosyltransferase family protein [[Mycoplasma] gypis]